MHLIQFCTSGPPWVDLSTQHLKSIAKFCHFSALGCFLFLFVCVLLGFFVNKSSLGYSVLISFKAMDNFTLSVSDEFYLSFLFVMTYRVNIAIHSNL